MALDTLSQCVANDVAIWATCQNHRCEDPGRMAELDVKAIIAKHGDLSIPDLRRRVRCRLCGVKTEAISLVTRHH